MSSSSSDGHHKKQKHSMVGNINDVPKSIQEDMKGFSPRITNIENGQAAMV